VGLGGGGALSVFKRVLCVGVLWVAFGWLKAGLGCMVAWSFNLGQMLLFSV
jgi:hypothetical protein